MVWQLVEHRQSSLKGQLHYFEELQQALQQSHWQENRFSKQQPRHGRPASQRTIMPRQPRRIFYYFLQFQTYQRNLPELLSHLQGHLEVLQRQHQILDFVLHATLAIPHMWRRKKRPAVRSRSGTPPATRRTAPFADMLTPEVEDEPAQSTSLRAADSKGSSSTQCERRSGICRTRSPSIFPNCGRRRRGERDQCWWYHEDTSGFDG